MWRHIKLDCYYCQKKFLPEIPSCRVCPECSGKCPRCGDKSGVLVCGTCLWAMEEEGLQKYPDIYKEHGLYGANPDCMFCQGNGYFASPDGSNKLCECRKNGLAQKR